jgi:nickel-type superoxide dismutase maturation protease
MGAAAVLGVGATRVRRFEVAGESMLPGLEPGDRLLLVRTRRLAPGDVVVVPDPRDVRRLVVKRVTRTSGSSVLVQGDNPAASTDSRTFGPVARAEVRGRVFYRYFPPARRGGVGRLVP